MRTASIGRLLHRFAIFAASAVRMRLAEQFKVDALVLERGD